MRNLHAGLLAALALASLAAGSPPSNPSLAAATFDRFERERIEYILLSLNTNRAVRGRRLELLAELEELEAAVRLYEMVYLVFLRDVRTTIAGEPAVTFCSPLDVLTRLTVNQDPELRAEARRVKNKIFGEDFFISRREFQWLTSEEIVTTMRGEEFTGYLQDWIVNRYLEPSGILDRILDDYRHGTREFNFREAREIARAYGSLLAPILPGVMENASRDPAIMARPGELRKFIFTTVRLISKHLQPEAARELSIALEAYYESFVDLRKRAELPEYVKTLQRLGVDVSDRGLDPSDWNALTPAEVRNMKKEEKKRAKAWETSAKGERS